MNAYQITEALSASFFALLGIWAAVDQRHWFVRFVIVSGILLVTLLIPAYEVVIEFGLQTTIIMAGVWLVRGRTNWRPRLSVETALLAMVVVAVTTAVIARIPDLHPGVWAFVITVGVCTGYVGLLALWVVCGESRMRTRLIFGPLGLALFVLLFHFGHAVQHALWRSSGGFNKQALVEFYQWDRSSEWLSRMLPTIALAAAILLGVLTLSRATRWFAVVPAQHRTRLPRRVIAARIGLCCVFLAVAAPLAYTFYRLMTPPSLKLADPPPSLNGFDDFVAAGNLTWPNIENLIGTRPTRAASKQLFDDLQPVADAVSKGLAKRCLIPIEDPQSISGVSIEKSQALNRAAAALFLRMEYLAEHGTVQDHVAATLMLLRYPQEASRGSLSVWEGIGYSQDLAMQQLRFVIYRLDAEQLRHMSEELCELDASREPFEAKIKRQLLIDQNGEWTRHLAMLLDAWSGLTPYEGHCRAEQRQVARLRVTGADLAVQAYYRENRKPPDSLDELVPEYLVAVPRDVFLDVPLRYRREGARYSIYSVGPDGIDDRDAAPTRSARDDEIVTGPHHPPLWMQVRDWIAIGLEKLDRYVHREGEAPAEPL